MIFYFFDFFYEFWKFSDIQYIHVYLRLLLLPYLCLESSETWHNYSSGKGVHIFASRDLICHISDFLEMFEIFHYSVHSCLTNFATPPSLIFGIF